MLEFLIFFLMGMLIVALISFTCFLLRNAINGIRVTRSPILRQKPAAARNC